MDNFFAVVGAVVVVALSLALLAATFALLSEVAGKAYDKWRFDIIYRRDAELGEVLKSGAHYMDEEALRNLLEWLAIQIQGGYSLYAGHWYDGWIRYRDAKRRASPSSNLKECKDNHHG